LLVFAVLVAWAFAGGQTKTPARAYLKRGDLIYQGRWLRTYSTIVRDD